MKSEKSTKLKNLQQAMYASSELTENYTETGQELSKWPNNKVPKTFTVFSLPKEHQVSMRTSNLIERAVSQQLKQRKCKVRVFPNEQALLRLATCVVTGIDKN